MSSGTATSSPLNLPKRQRTEEPAFEEIESPELWFNDGNIIIRSVADTSITPSTRTLYKLHKFAIAMHCSVFASLFSGPQDAFAVGSEHREGLPVMDLTDDPEELRSFLKALYIPRETHDHLSSHPRPPWEVLPAKYYGILRLAFKYDASDIVEMLLPVLKKQWPSNIAAWDRLRVPHQLPHMPYKIYVDPLPAIRLGVECNIPDILPLAYYVLACQLSGPRAQRANLLALLTLNDIRTVYLGQMSFKDELDASFLVEKVPECRCMTNGPSRGKHVRDWYREVVGANTDDPVGLMRRIADIAPLLTDNFLCTTCRCWLVDTLLKKRKAFWQSLPKLFALDDVSPHWGTAETLMG
ncbi:hypothetical protein FA95DRAFT_1605515 [Auriscalpium vulgare]|uniref:Uncharacterized protein n=1 Tax=Auriscalpium vulgare TaxID=40419 RepID=A0ACB8RX32_9AGAM|nr:hypothetical protein FA95DRAFT_1605515 [Auriscalpium vulgare]